MDALIELLEYGGHDGSDPYCSWCVFINSQRTTKGNMDPTANLEEQLRIARRILNDGDDRDSERLAELIEALDDWIRSGGFLPTTWAAVIDMRVDELVAERMSKTENTKP